MSLDVIDIEIKVNRVQKLLDDRRIELALTGKAKRR
jgi:hypothetical protein